MIAVVNTLAYLAHSFGNRIKNTFFVRMTKNGKKREWREDPVSTRGKAQQNFI
jgi:hypothetical protein